MKTSEKRRESQRRYRHRRRDEQILAMIIASVEVNNLTLTQGNWGFGIDDEGSISRSYSYEACAIGAGFLYRPLRKDILKAIATSESFYYDHQLIAFSKAYRVSLAYAQGVNDGFELVGGHSTRLFNDPDYIRGMAVGAAALSYAEDESIEG